MDCSMRSYKGRADGKLYHPPGFYMQGAIPNGPGISDRPAHSQAHAPEQTPAPPPPPPPPPPQNSQQSALGPSEHLAHRQPAATPVFQSMPMPAQCYAIPSGYPAAVVPVTYTYNYIPPAAVDAGAPALHYSYPVYHHSAPIHQHTYDSQVATYRYQAWLRSPAGQKAKAEADAAAAKKTKEDKEAAEKKKKADEAAAIAAAGWNTMYFSGGEDTRQTMIRAGLNGVSCDVGEWKWIGEPGNGGFRICEVRKKKNVQPPKGAEGMTPALAWHLMQGVSGPPSWGYGPAHGTFQPPQPSGGNGIPRYAGGSGYPVAQPAAAGYPGHINIQNPAGLGPYSNDCQCQECAAARAYGAHPYGHHGPDHGHCHDHHHHHHRH